MIIPVGGGGGGGDGRVVVSLVVVYIIIANYALLISTVLTIQSSILTLFETLSPPIETCLLLTLSGGDVVDMSFLLF